jgi:hypothetical protein
MKSKKRVVDVMAEVYKHKDFEKVKEEGPNHSVCKLPDALARRSRCSKDDTDHPGAMQKEEKQ